VLEVLAEHLDAALGVARDRLGLAAAAAARQCDRDPVRRLAARGRAGSAAARDRIARDPAAAILLLSGWQPPWRDSSACGWRPVRLGVFNGLAAIGGMAVAVMLFATTITGAAARARR
jgi:hypothetical protein